MWIREKTIFENRRLLAVKILLLVISVAMIFINPVGYKIIDTVTGFLGNSYLTSHTVEYQPPNLLSQPFIPFTIYLMILGLGILRFRKKITLVDTLQLLAWSIFGLVSARNIPLAVIIGLPILSSIYGDRWNKSHVEIQLNTDRSEITWGSRMTLISFFSPMIITVFIVGLVTNAPNFQSRNKFLPNVFPVDAVSYLEIHPPKGKVYNEFTWGGYLLYRIWPNQKVFIDGQTDFYGEDLTREYEQVYFGLENYQEILEKYQIEWVIVKSSSNLARLLDKNNEWGIMYQDELAVIFSRK